ncbi:hypothetical protein [Streptomyces sp. NPDC059957]|uniref:DUF7779 domain-containing protein n=1 Tax=unclassified Streptomyces TaxID=2593676 RepID=UPI003648CAC1
MSGSLTQVLPRREPVVFPHQVGVLPVRAGCFQGRAAVSALREAVAGGGTAVVCQVLAGMGGIGKTQLAADRARHAWSNDEVDLLVWVTAATRHAVIDAYTQAAVDVLAAVADDLGHLPLALSRAAVYLTDTHLDAATYRTRLADRQLPDLLPEPGALPDDQPSTVAAAWSLSLDRADQLRPAGLARPMLQLTAMLDPNGIPEEVLTRDQALAHLAAHRTTPSGDSPGALRALHRLSLVGHTPDTPHRAVRVHQLIQRAIRDPLAPDQQDQLARTAADALTAAWPDPERDTDLAQVLRANTTALTSCAGDALYRPDAHVVLDRNGRSLGEAGQVAAAIDHFHHLTDTADHHLGPDHPDTLAARPDLVWWRGKAVRVASLPAGRDA